MRTQLDFGRDTVSLQLHRVSDIRTPLLDILTCGKGGLGTQNLSRTYITSLGNAWSVGGDTFLNSLSLRPCGILIHRRGHRGSGLASIKTGILYRPSRKFFSLTAL